MSSQSVLSHFALLIVVCANLALAQSQPLDARIEGSVTDLNGSVVSGSAITVINITNGARSTSSSGENGSFTFPILTLGTYTITVEHPGFKRFVREGISLSAGQTASVNIILQPGDLDETVTVTAETAIGDASRFDVGRQLTSREVRNLPLVSRNPFNFILLQPGTTGRSVGSPLVVGLSSNGLLRRVGNKLDGNNINEADVGGFRLVFLSEAFVKEVQLLSGGYSAEFGDTAGTVVNFITPSGTNRFTGTLSTMFRPTWLTAKPFGYAENGPNPNLNGMLFVGTAGGPIVKDRWHFYAGYERAHNEIPQLISITPAKRAALTDAGVSAGILQDTAANDTLPYLIVRTDAQVAKTTRVAIRYNRFDTRLRNALSFTSAGLNTRDRSFDFEGWDHAIGAQAVSTFSQTFFNEVRFQRAERLAGHLANDLTGTGPSIAIAGVANLGPPTNINSLGTNQSLTELRNAVTKVFERHSLKLGGGVNFIRDTRLSATSVQYNFNSIDEFRLAITGTNPRSYSQYIESFGDTRLPMDVVFANLFIQDEWSVTRRLKLTVGLRYDVYVPPRSAPGSTSPFFGEFNTDPNNLAPRLGGAFLLRDGKYRTVLRGASGIHFDPPFLNYYRRALQNNGDPRFQTFRVRPNDPRNGGFAPDFPNTLGVLPPGAIQELPDIDAISPDFRTMYAVHTSLQLEQALGENTSLSFGLLYSAARHIPVYRNVNCLPSVNTLADGRPVYDCGRRVYPQFDLVMVAEAVGNLSYRGVFAQLNRRLSGGLQIHASYTLSRAEDDAPEDAPGSMSASDPSSRSRDRGASVSDVRHVFRMSLVAEPRIRTTNRVGALLNGYQISLISFADSGENQNLVVGFDLNRDGVFGPNGPDRPAGIPRNFIRRPPFFSLDLRLSRSFGVGRSRSLSVFAEAANVFNSKSLSSYLSTTLNEGHVDPESGLLRGPLPDLANGAVAWRPSRQVQAGLRLSF